MNTIATVMFRLYSGLSIAGVTICILLMALSFTLHERLNTFLAKTIAAQNAVALGRAVREQYIHELHGLVYKTSSHVHHHDEWVDDASSQIRALEARAPRSVIWRARRAKQLSDDLDALFEDQLLPAALRGDTVAVTRLHAEARAMSDTAVSHADALAAFLSDEAELAYDGALRIARVAFISTILGGILLLWMFLLARRRLAAKVLSPLANFVHHIDDPSDDDPRELAVLRSRIRDLNHSFAARKSEVMREERLAILGKLCSQIADVLDQDLARLTESVQQLERVHHSIPTPEVAILVDEVRTCRRLADDLATWRQRPSLELVWLDIVVFVESVLERVPGHHIVNLEQCELLVDPVRVGQIVQNVIRNALQAAPAQPVQIHGWVASSHYELRIEDVGPGIPSEMLIHVFEPFFTTRSGGTGLGLAICRELAVAHGGDLGIANSPTGAVVTLTLPLTHEGSLP